MTDKTLPPPGWYTDPLDPNVQRYWGGDAWTDDARQTPPPSLRPIVQPQLTVGPEARLGMPIALGIGVFVAASTASWIVHPSWLDASDGARGFWVFAGLLVAGIVGSGIWLGMTVPKSTNFRSAITLSAAVAALLTFVLFGMYGQDDSAGLAIFMLAAILFGIGLALALFGAAIGRAIRAD